MKKEKVLMYWYCEFAPHYQWSKDGKICININTNNTIQRIYNNGSIGYKIDCIFKSLKTIRKSLKIIGKTY